MTAVTLYAIEPNVIPISRSTLLRRALRLEAASVLWSALEGGVGIAAALASASVVLLGFGADSVVESVSATLMLWRLAGERRARDAVEIARLEDRARRLVAGSLIGLSLYVAADALHGLVAAQRPRFSPVGVGLLLISMTLMMALARAKRRTAAALESRALAADAFQTTACWWLSAIALAGIALNALWGWWWADPVAALGAALLIAREGHRTLRGEETCCSHGSHRHPTGISAVGRR